MGLLRDVTTHVSGEKVNIASLVTRETEEGIAIMELTVFTTDVNQLSRLFTKLEEVQGMIKVNRVNFNKSPRWPASPGSKDQSKPPNKGQRIYMPSEKSHRVSLKKTVRNKAARSSAKSAVTEAKRALDSDSRDEATAAVARASSVLDVGATKGRAAPQQRRKAQIKAG